MKKKEKPFEYWRYPKVGPHFITPTFITEYKGLSDKLNIRKTDYYKPKGGQTINLQKDLYFKELKKYIKQTAEGILNLWYHPKEKYRIDIVSMWLNSNQKNMNHPPHNHLNSFLSGVFYLDGVEREYESLNILRPYALPNLPIVKKYNEINSNVIYIPTCKDRVVFFPSYYMHYVGINKKRKPRLSISFDIILRGKYGEIRSDELSVGQYRI